MKSQDIIEKLEENREDIRGFGVNSIELIGSYARDEQSGSSDIDFLVDFENDRGLYRDYKGLKNLLESLFDEEIDLVKRKYVREELRDNILGGERVEAKI